MLPNDELRKIDREHLLAEKEVLEALLKEHAGSHRCGYWREELQRINESLKGLFLSVGS